MYDGLQLLQEWELTGGGRDLRAQYYYADEGDIPFAADLYDASTRRLERHYYRVDRMGSVVGLTDAVGTEDSVNLYAGMRWDPVNLREPTGRGVEEFNEGIADPYRTAEYKLSKVDDFPVERVSLSDPDVYKNFKRRFNPIDGEGALIVVVAKKARSEALRLLRQLNKIR